MKAECVIFKKFRQADKYIIQLSVHRVQDTRYLSGFKYSLICVDLETGFKVLMGNHTPKGPHYHINDDQFDYEFESINKLLTDFELLVNETFGEIL